MSGKQPVVRIGRIDLPRDGRALSGATRAAIESAVANAVHTTLARKLPPGMPTSINERSVRK